MITLSYSEVIYSFAEICETIDGSCLFHFT